MIDAIHLVIFFSFKWSYRSSYAILLFTASNLASITSHIHNWVLFLLWLHPFILSGVISPRSPVAYWAPNDLGSPSFGILSFCLFTLLMGFSRQEYWSGLLFLSLVDHDLSGDRDQDHTHGKVMQKSKMAVWGGLTNGCEKKRGEKKRRKGEI